MCVYTVSEVLNIYILYLLHEVSVLTTYININENQRYQTLLNKLNLDSLLPLNYFDFFFFFGYCMIGGGEEFWSKLDGNVCC